MGRPEGRKPRRTSEGTLRPFGLRVTEKKGLRATWWGVILRERKRPKDLIRPFASLRATKRKRPQGDKKKKASGRHKREDPSF